MVRATEAFLGCVGTRLHFRCAHVCLGFPLSFASSVFVPSIWFPISSFPLCAQLFSSFLSCPPVFMFCHLILSFVCAHIGPGLSLYAQIYLHFKHRSQVAQVLTMRWGSSVVPVHLVSLSLQPHTLMDMRTDLTAVPHASLRNPNPEKPGEGA